MKDLAARLLDGMLRIYSPSGHEEEMAKFVSKSMARLGYRVEVDGAGNVLGWIGSGRPVALLCAHMDTVAGRLPVRWEGDIVWGRGAVDCKGPLTALILAGWCFAQREEGSVAVAAVVDEELGATGIRWLTKQPPPAPYAVFGEPSGGDGIVVGYRGIIILKLTVQTKQGHAASPWLFENAIEHAYKLWSIIKRLKDTHSRPGSHFHTLSASLTMIEGGTYPNVIPGECKLTINIRTPPEVRCSDVLSEVDSIVNRFTRKHLGVSVSCSVADAVDAYLADVNTALVKAFKRAVPRVLGRRPRVVKKTATGDMNVAGARWGIPMLTYGPGDPRLSHTANERIDVNEVVASANVVAEALRILLDEAGEAG